jgi:hypothetical protein
MATRPKFFKGAGLRVRYDGVPALHKAIAELVKNEVLVGFPEETDSRDDGSPLTNAAIGYIQDNGAPEANIPARPFMIPGITPALPKVTEILRKSAQYGLDGNTNKIQEGFERIGLLAVSSIQSYIKAGIGPPLTDYTVAKRAAKGRQGAKAELARRAAGYGPSAPGAGLVTPLIDTAEMLKAIAYVVRPKSKRGK